MAANLAEYIFKCINTSEKLHFDSNLTEVCSYGSNRQQVSIGSGNGLAPSHYMNHRSPNSLMHIYVALGGDELTDKYCV